MGRGGASGDAVERRYRVFERYGPTAGLDVSPLRDAGAILRASRSAPSRDLGQEDVPPYAAWAMTTVGGPDDYKHFLPRIFELALDDPPHLGAEPAIMAGKLLRAGWRTWPAHEHSAVRAAFFAAWVWTPGRDADEQDAVRWLKGLAMPGDVADALQAWQGSSSAHAVGHPASFVYDRRDRPPNGEAGGGPFWDDAVPGARGRVTAWLLGRDVRRLLDTAAPPASPFTRWQFDEARRVASGRPGLAGEGRIAAAPTRPRDRPLRTGGGTGDSGAGAQVFDWAPWDSSWM